MIKSMQRVKPWPHQPESVIRVASLRGRLAAALAMLLVVGFAYPTPAVKVVATPPQVRSVWVRYPQTVSPSRPLRVLVALHGIGGDGPSFADDLTANADLYGWVLVAPTIEYGNWMDPTQVAQEDAALVTWLSGYVDRLAADSQQPLQPEALLLGFSRGAQLAHRFAEAFPNQTQAVAAVSAGAYTLPQASASDGTPLPFPYGVADFQTTVGQSFVLSDVRLVHFWIGIGTTDTNANDVPRQFDAFEGTNRLTRARAFVAALERAHVSAQLAVFPGVAHALTPDMLQAAVAFLAAEPTPATAGDLANVFGLDASHPARRSTQQRLGPA